MPAPSHSQGLEPVDDFGANPGKLDMFIRLPVEPTSGMPLVVALHGCRQSAADLDDETGLAALAEETPFLLVLPQQRLDNQWRNCFRWYDQSHNRPGKGESASILAMIDAAIARFDVDPEEVYILGLSAGGAMTAVMLANYPDRFAAGAIIAGLPFDCNRPANAFDWWWYSLHHNPLIVDGADASYACGIVGGSATDRDAGEWGEFVRSVNDRAPERWPLVSIWQGSDDETVDPANLDELVEQWTNVHGIDATADEERVIGRAEHRVYSDASGQPRVEAWVLNDFPHAFPIDADGVLGPCGHVAEFIEDADLCAARRVVEFWTREP